MLSDDWLPTAEIWSFENLAYKTLPQCDADTDRNADDRVDWNISSCASYRQAKNSVPNEKLNFVKKICSNSNFELMSVLMLTAMIKWAASSDFVSSSIPSWQILTAHAQPFRGARDLAFCLNVPLDSLIVWASSEGSGETARMRRLAWTFAARIGDKYQIRLAWPKLSLGISLSFAYRSRRNKIHLLKTT